MLNLDLHQLESCDRCFTIAKVKAMSSSSLPSRTSQEGDRVVNESVSPMSTADEDDRSDVLPLSKLQSDDGRGGPLRVESSTSELADRCTTISDLPDELMLKIFSYLSISENINVLQAVSTHWKVLAQDAHLWHNQQYVVRWDTSEEEAIATFATMPQLRTVILEKEVSPRVFKVLSGRCLHLTRLETDNRQMLTYSEADNFFYGCRKIRTLTISDMGLRTDVRFLDAVARLADLRVLHLRETYGETVVVPLRILADSCPHLYDLDTGRASGLYYRITDAEYFINSQKRILKCLRIWSISVEGRSIATLLPPVERLQSLQLIEYGGGQPEDAAEALGALGQLHSLQKLHFNFTIWGLRHLVPEVFGSGGLPKLQKLSLEYLVVDKTTCALAEHCPELRELKLCKCEEHTDTLLEPLCRLEKLESLKIRDCRCLGGKAMSFIAKLPALHTLELINIRFDKLKPSMDCILEITGLRRLCIGESKCDDIPFDKFPGRLVNLRELEISYCDGDQKVLDRVCTQMPELKVKVKGSLRSLITS